MQAATTLTDLIRRARDGDEQALKAFFDVTYEDLRRMARARLSKAGRGPLLDTTSLVHESYLRFANAGQLQIADRAHFFRYAAQVMRSVIVDLARARLAERHGGGAAHVRLRTDVANAVQGGEDEIVRVHEALEELRSYDERMLHVVEMRYFGGMTEAEIADALGVTDRTVRRDWEKARLILARTLL
jgi:RNA polymerase sigma factor (TIGR02999 family)